MVKNCKSKSESCKVQLKFGLHGDNKTLLSNIKS